MKKMGYDGKDIEDSLKQCKYDDIMALYLLLGRKPVSDVSPLLSFSQLYSFYCMKLSSLLIHNVPM